MAFWLSQFLPARFGVLMLTLLGLLTLSAGPLLSFEADVRLDVPETSTRFDDVGHALQSTCRLADEPDEQSSREELLVHVCAIRAVSIVPNLTAQLPVFVGVMVDDSRPVSVASFSQPRRQICIPVATSVQFLI